MRREIGDQRRQQSAVPEAAFARLNMLGHAPAFAKALRTIGRIAAVDATVLIQGETGTGKELAARAVHYLSRRRDFPFIPVNCGALPDNLLESELFGHERGAFTDARQASRGLVAQAEGGTLFLDEVEAITPRGQVVLLRFLQDHTYRPVGGRLTSTGNLRVIASSNVDLETLVRDGQFRSDLLFRFDVLSVTMPPLRQRGDDVALLAEHFLHRFAAQYSRPAKRLDPATIAWMSCYAWPGNVRELENLVLRELLLDDAETIRIEPPESANAMRVDPEGGFDRAFKQAKAQAVAQFEKNYLRYLLTKTSGNVSLAARISQKDRSALNKLVKKHGFTVQQFRAPPPDVPRSARAARRRRPARRPTRPQVGRIFLTGSKSAQAARYAPFARLAAISARPAAAPPAAKSRQQAGRNRAFIAISPLARDVHTPSRRFSDEGVKVARPSERIAVIASLIDGYVTEHPRAADTPKGICEWWVTRQGHAASLAEVQEALDHLVGLRRLRRTVLADSTVIYARARPDPEPPQE